ncbi:MAG: AMP nucleosidase [Pseudomonadota bacterium]
MIFSVSSLPVVTPDIPAAERVDTADAAVDGLIARYEAATAFLRARFEAVLAGEPPVTLARAYYPKISLTTSTFAQIDSRLAFGHVVEPGTYEATVTRPDLFRSYLRQQIGLLIDNHHTSVEIDVSTTPIPLHFALGTHTHVDGAVAERIGRPLRDLFDVPDLNSTDDAIVNGQGGAEPAGVRALSLFTAQRIDYSLARLTHYTATDAEHFQNHVLFTNYQFYIDEFVRLATAAVNDPTSGYSSLVLPGNVTVTAEGRSGETPGRLPQMPAYHLIRADGAGITMVNIGVGPSNAKTITDHIAVLRPHVWLMLGHCAGLRNSQSLGDYVLAHAYVREDHVLDEDLPTWVPIPALAEVQIALQDAVAEVTGYTGYDLKRIMRTGTVATIDNRNWELRDHSGPVQRLSLSRAIALDMESATIAANGFRFRVPYGTLLCVSDKPLHGELKLPGMATAFYKTQVAQHLEIGIRAMEALRDMPLERMHSRKLRSFEETAFL